MDSAFIRYITNNKTFWSYVYKSDNPNIHVNISYKTECKSSNELFKRPQKELKESTSNKKDPRHCKCQTTPTSFVQDFVAVLLENKP